MNNCKIHIIITNTKLEKLVKIEKVHAFHWKFYSPEDSKLIDIFFIFTSLSNGILFFCGSVTLLTILPP